MPNQDVCDEVARFFSDHLNIGVFSLDADLFETGILDSLSFVDLIMHLEQRFDIHIGAEELEPENFRSLGRIAAFVAAHGCLNKVDAA